MAPDRGVRLHVGHVGAPDAAPMVLTHGGGDDSSTWAEQVPHLARRWRVTTWDLRGHGRSDRPEGVEHYDRSAALDDLRRVLALAGVDRERPAVLVGHSLGGYLSLATAILHPELVRALVLVATGPGFRDPAARQRWNDGIAALAPRMGLRPDVARLAEQPDAFVIDRLAEVSCPTLVIVGSEDARYHAGCRYLERVLRAELVMVPGGGHHVHATHAAIVNEAIERVAGR